MLPFSNSKVFLRCLSQKSFLLYWECINGTALANNWKRSTNCSRSGSSRTPPWWNDEPAHWISSLAEFDDDRD